MSKEGCVFLDFTGSFTYLVPRLPFQCFGQLQVIIGTVDVLDAELMGIRQ